MSARRILVVDDMSSIRNVIVALLRSAGFETVDTSNAATALQFMDERRFDLVLSDWNMPVMNGHEFVSAIRSKDTITPVVMVTAEADRQKILAMREIGVSGYLLKPFKPQALLAVVDQVFSR